MNVCIMCMLCMYSYPIPRLQTSGSITSGSITHSPCCFMVPRDVCFPLLYVLIYVVYICTPYAHTSVIHVTMSHIKLPFPVQLAKATKQSASISLQQ